MWFLRCDKKDGGGRTERPMPGRRLEQALWQVVCHIRFPRKTMSYLFGGRRDAAFTADELLQKQQDCFPRNKMSRGRIS
jgi:hypothetical protein